MSTRRTHRAACLSALALAIAAGQACADVIIGNMPGNDATQSISLQNGRIKAMGFTMPPGEDYTLTHIELRLDATVDSIPLVRLFSDVGGSPSAEILTLDNPVITSAGSQTYEFTPPSSFELSAGTAYWVIVYNIGPGSISWKGSTPAQIPTGIAFHSGSLFSTNTGPGAPTGTSAVMNSYAVHGLPATAICYANCDASTTEPILNVDDFTCFINEFAQAQNLPHEQQVTHYANCDESTTAPVLNVDDFTCFINAFATGCP